ncbi:MAG: hypothetical protein LW823_05715 [Rickettsiales bacterium]|jgi:hypothetical protein|nr:hypothetical protein [Rickettsiales bacterium]
MLPAVNSAPVIVPAPVIVATTVPGNNVLRVAPDNVAPNVSNVPVGDNTRRGSGATSSQAAPVTSTVASGFSSLVTFLDGTPSSLSLNASTTFMAQLISQDNSPYARGVLSEYEKLVVLSQVKYKPSNASMPEPEPNNIFSQILKQEQQTKASTQTALMAQAATANAQQASLGSTAIKTPAPLKETEAESEAKPAEPVEAEPAQAAAPTQTPPRPIIAAYLATAARNDALKKPTVESI